ncbi:DUF3857 domain-containing protein [Polaribacter uvawellassae]|uniref:DUF3857 domain-containing protein n=1 Tax=Polaribacter uvawellassae TaxID=3133495 RepID=UPI00321BD080
MKKSSPKISVLFLLCIVQLTFAQKIEHSSILIPAELLKNANAVVRNNATAIDVYSTDEMTVKVDRVVTVLNKLGNGKVGAYVGYDDNSKITKLSAKIYDAAGREIKKVSKNKFVDVSAFDGGTLYSDSRVKYLDYTPITYPYTVHLQYEYNTSSTGFLQNWSPLEGYLVSIENNSYVVNLNNGKIRVKELNFDGYEIEKTVSDSKVYYSVKNISAIRNESLSPSLTDYKPKALVALNNFKTDGVDGYYTNWDEFGRWMYSSLLDGRGIVDGATKIKILDLVKGVEDPIEKAKIVYNFMQNKTRYISVQVGIGGIQPIPANEVDNVGYGDCKGLTNYTKALLDIVGVTSYYTHVEANSFEPVSFEKDFASLEQGNHVILNIPNNGNDIWLECTSQVTPFGFLGDFTDDRDVLVITPEGGVLKRTTSYKNEQNLQKTKATIVLNANGSLKADVLIKSEGTQYGSKYELETLNLKEQKNFYKSNLWSYNNNTTIDEIEFTNDKDSVVFTEKIAATIKDYSSISSDKILFRVNVFNRNNNTPKRYRNRVLPLKIRRGYKDVDEYTITLPVGFKIDGVLMNEKKIENRFGFYSISIEKINETQIRYKRTLLIKEGTHPKEDYKKYRTFRRNVSKNDNLRIALAKTN